MKDIVIKVRVSQSEKDALETKANGKPLSAYLREFALGSGASETLPTDDVASELRLFLKHYPSAEAFRDALLLGFGVSTESEFVKKLEAKRKGVLEASAPNPLYGYRVIEINAEGIYGTLLRHPNKQDYIMSEHVNEHNLFLVYHTDRDWSPRYAVGDVIGPDLPEEQNVNESVG